MTKRLFSNADVEEARLDFERGMSIGTLQSKFAMKCGVWTSYASVEQMLYGVTYKDAPGPILPPPEVGAPARIARLTPKVSSNRGPKRRLTNAQISEVRGRSRYGLERTTDLAEEFGVPPTLISNIKIGRTGKLVPESPTETAARLEFEKLSINLERLRRSYLSREARARLDKST